MASVRVAICFWLVICNAITALSDSCAHKSLRKISLSKEDDLATLVQKFFDKVEEAIQNNDPFSIDNTNLNYNSYGLWSKGYVRNVLISYFSSVVMKNLEVKENQSSIDFGIDMYFEKVQFSGDYDLQFDFLTMLPLYGAGKLGLLLSGFSLSVKTSFKETQDNLLQLSQIQLTTSVNSTEVSTEKLFNNESLGVYLGHVITSVLADLVNENRNGSTVLNFGLRSLLNSLMCSSAITLDTIVDFIKGFIA